MNTNPLRFPVLALVTVFLLGTVLLGARGVVHADGSTVKITTYQVLGSKDGKPGMPEALEPYKKNLTLTGLKSFSIAQTRSLTLTQGKALELPLTRGLGKATLTLRADGKVLLVVKHGEKESRLVVPVGFVFANEKIKTKDGKQFFLILEKPKSK